MVGWGQTALSIAPSGIVSEPAKEGATGMPRRGKHILSSTFLDGKGASYYSIVQVLLQLFLVKAL